MRMKAKIWLRLFEKRRESFLGMESSSSSTARRRMRMGRMPRMSSRGAEGKEEGGEDACAESGEDGAGVEVKVWADVDEGFEEVRERRVGRLCRGGRRATPPARPRSRVWMR